MRAVHVVLSGCDQAPLRGQQPKSLRLCRRIVTHGEAAPSVVWKVETAVHPDAYNLGNHLKTGQRGLRHDKDFVSANLVGTSSADQ